MFWTKSKPVSAEVGETSRDKQPRRRLLPAAATSALVSLALLSGCGEQNGTTQAEKAQKQEAKQAKIGRNNKRLNAVLHPAAVSLAARAVKLSEGSDPIFIKLGNNGYPDPPRSVTFAAGVKTGAIEDDAYVTMLKTQGQPDPTKVIKVGFTSKLNYGHEGQRHIWKNSADITAPHVPHLSSYGQGDAWAGFGTSDPTSENGDHKSITYYDTLDIVGVDYRVIDARAVVRSAQSTFNELIHAEELVHRQQP